MKTTILPCAVSRTASLILASGLICGVPVISGCAPAVKVESTPPGAAVTIESKALGTTPAQWQVENANFTSNRGDRTKSDVFRVNLVEGKIVGGLARLTRKSGWCGPRSVPRLLVEMRSMQGCTVVQSFA